MVVETIYLDGKQSIENISTESEIQSNSNDVCRYWYYTATQKSQARLNRERRIPKSKPD